MTAHILAAKRSAVVPRGGAFAALAPHELAAPVIRTLLQEAGLGPDDVDELIVSNALGAGGNPARLCALAAGLPKQVAGLSVDRQCAGGLDAIGLAAALVRSGAANVVIAGGVESYSRAPIRLHRPLGDEPPQAYDRPAFSPWPHRDPDMHAAADALAKSTEISAEAMAEFAVQSHAKSIAHRAEIAPQIVPIAGQTQDAFARNLTPQVAARAPALAGDISAATTAISADAAAFVLVCTADHVPTGTQTVRILQAATLGAAPEQPGLSPVPAISAVLTRTGLAADDLSSIELMEAYAAQAIAVRDICGLPAERMNIWGGALARGHPIGASGAINAVMLSNQLLATGGAGLAAIAAAGGVGSALLLQV